ncbi:ribosomal biogenesis GTPase [Spirochaetia bacterium]|nr:ribosomal biogenesis GTPase [Spirochaetia bacterium]
MNVEIKAMHFSLEEENREYLDKKLTRIRNAENMIVDLIITLSKEGTSFKADASVNFKWGVKAYVKEEDYDLSTVIDKMIDKLEGKITKEKEKIKDKR